jgi:AraC family transcriptional regulator
LAFVEAAASAGDSNLLAAEPAHSGAVSGSRVWTLARGGLAPWQLARVDGHIERRLASRLTNAGLASLVRLSEDHFARAFKVSIGCSPHAYVVARRIERAKSLMTGTNLPLSQIAVAAGFSDQSHLSRCFRDTVGAAPASWRRRFS